LKRNPLQNRVGGMTQSVGLEFKPQYCKKKIRGQLSYIVKPCLKKIKQLELVVSLK
jgi:hypothetical protein